MIHRFIRWLSNRYGITEDIQKETIKEIALNLPYSYFHEIPDIKEMLIFLNHKYQKGEYKDLGVLSRNYILSQRRKRKENKGLTATVQYKKRAMRNG